MIENYIERALRELGYTWKKDGEVIQPDAELIRRTLDDLKRMLYPEDEGAMLMLGRMLVQKRDTGKFDIYLMIGEDNG